MKFKKLSRVVSLALVMACAVSIANPLTASAATNKTDTAKKESRYFNALLLKYPLIIINLFRISVTTSVLPLGKVSLTLTLILLLAVLDVDVILVPTLLGWKTDCRII